MANLHDALDNDIEAIQVEMASIWWLILFEFLLSTLGQGLVTSTYPGEVLFSIAVAILGLLLFALLIGNMQVYIQASYFIQTFLWMNSS